MRRLQPRLAALLGAITTGFADAALGSGLREQEAIRKREEGRLAVFTKLGRALSASTSADAAADIIAAAADELFGWDAYSLTLFEADGASAHIVLNYDQVDGRRTRVPAVQTAYEAGSITRRVIDNGPLLLLPEPSAGIPGTAAFGDAGRPSASLMFVPIRGDNGAFGMLTLQSYTPHAYTPDDLNLLQALADHCGGALERMRAAAWLQHSEATNRALLNAMPDLIFRLDRDGKFLDFSGHHDRLPAAKATFVGKMVEHVLPQPLATRTKYFIQRAFDTREVQVFEYELEINGFTRHEEARIVVCGDDEVLIVVREITERKRMEAARVQARKLESIAVLSAGIAHEFNNLLMVMLGHAELAQLDLPPDASAHDNLVRIERAARRAAQLTKQMLTFAGDGQSAFLPIDLSSLVDSIQHHLPNHVRQRARLDYRLAADLPAVLGDADQLQQVLLDLVANAADALAAAGDAVSITTGSVVLSATDLEVLAPVHNLASGHYVFVDVVDNGCGMDADTQAKMFDPFFSNKPSGSGLSLAAALGIVRGHHGTIQVRSTVGAGTTVRIMLPVSPLPMPQPAFRSPNA